MSKSTAGKSKKTTSTGTGSGTATGPAISKKADPKAGSKGVAVSSKPDGAVASAPPKTKTNEIDDIFSGNYSKDKGSAAGESEKRKAPEPVAAGPEPAKKKKGKSKSSSQSESQADSKPTPSAEAKATATPVVVTVDLSQAGKVEKTELPDDTDGFANSRGLKVRGYTEEGYKIYGEDELFSSTGGDTEDCPFDCRCCY
ncbi:uncharacterized protein BJ171DRAFT_82542 [Polychytrium aggregatum]|uniref:uncharacterized protein n=1 Tax=Polychytrium aggregatum TaxID=110093 RepID=UPI0022FE0730|nr:uncharacterized protein BJ171DRAFT_82542 [Polychytrium aggregatum]KAI9205067.1 hypothetical protein BJ171DRAFT_82542 [Polychytrium aggregatum]